MQVVNTILLPSENMKKITEGSINENVRNSIQLMQNYFGELRGLVPKSRDDISRAIIIGQEAKLSGEMVFEQINAETKRLGAPPLTKEEVKRFKDTVEKIHPETLKALIRLSPRIFGEDANKILSFSDKHNELGTEELISAFIRGARRARKVFERSPILKKETGDFMGRCIVWINALLDEDIATLNPHGPYTSALILDLKYAEFAYMSALEVMRENSIPYAGQGQGLEVRVHHEEKPVMLEIRIPISGVVSAARASAKLNAFIASRDVYIADSIHISFRGQY